MSGCNSKFFVPTNERFENSDPTKDTKSVGTPVPETGRNNQNNLDSKEIKKQFPFIYWCRFCTNGDDYQTAREPAECGYQWWLSAQSIEGDDHSICAMIGMPEKDETQLLRRVQEDFPSVAKFDFANLVSENEFIELLKGNRFYINHNQDCKKDLSCSCWKFSASN